MTIRKKIVAVSLAVFALLGVTQYVIQRQVLLPHFAKIEREQARAHMDRVSGAIARELGVIGLVTRDWGNWIAPYNFMLDHDPAFLKENVTLEAMRETKSNIVLLIGLDGEFVSSTALDPASGQLLSVDYLAGGKLAANDPLRGQLGKSTIMSGIIPTDHGPLLMAAAPILNGTGKGTPVGMLVLGRFLVLDELAQAANVAATDLRLLPPNDPEAAGSSARLGSVPGPDQPDTDRLVETDRMTYVYHELDDLAGRPMLTLRTASVRDISQSALRTILLASCLLTAVGGAALLALVAFLSRAVLEPLARITEHAKEIGNSDDLTKRLNRNGNDELGVLAGAFDHMVERLARTRSDLIDKSFEAGLAEMASGALHNLGNAMTPLTVRVTAMEQQLRSAPIADLELATTELARPDVDAQRRADLQQFAALASAQVIGAVQKTLAGCESAGRQLQAIQRILTDQMRQNRSGAVVESVRLGELITQSKELVSEAKRAQLQIEVAPQIEQLAAMKLPATVLRQVFQNLLVNASEAPAAPGRPVRVQIFAQIGEVAGRHELHCQFKDDGQGIAPDVLAKMFQRHFSTKSKANNSGIGLHWCANALHSLGAEIRVTSDGPGKGACFHIMVPLAAAKAIDAARAA